MVLRRFREASQAWVLGWMLGLFGVAIRTGLGATLVLGAGTEQPNIVLLYADNLGYGDLGCYGNEVIRTPRLDALSQEGVRCTSFYVVASSCTPSRGAILTGRYPLRNGLSHQLATTENWDGIGLPHRERILPQYLQEAGYATGCFGKWNIGFAVGSRPTERGFEEFLGCRSGNIHYFKHLYHGEYDLFRGTERYRVEGYSTEIFAEAACDFIQRQASQPFFLYLPFNAPHYVSSVNTELGEEPRWHVPSRYLEGYGWPADDQEEKHLYSALVTAMDEAVGRVLDTIDQQGLTERTLVMFLSDMGAILRPHHGLGVASNAPYRDGAPSVYEGGVRVPAIFRWPGKLPVGTVLEEVLCQLDILPLCLAVAGQPWPPERVLDGIDPLPVLRGEQAAPPRALVYNYREAFGLREGAWKIVRTRDNQPWELYQLDRDPTESQDVANQYPARVRQLDASFQRWRSEVQRDASPVAARPGRKPAQPASKP
jgi:arylsulfatase A